jgi:hypothetical protein
MADKIKLTIKNDRFQDLIDKLSDLTSIDDTIKLKIDNENTLMYSMLGGNVMLAFKNFLIKTNDYFEIKDELEYSYDVIIANCNKFVKNLEFLKTQPKITMTLSCKESQEDETVMSARSMQIVGGKLKVNWLAAERYEMRDINKDVLSQRLDLKNRKWSFIISKEDFSDVKKLSNINADKVININVIDGKVTLSEKAAWELEIGETEKSSASLIFNKRFFKCIDADREEIEFSMFENFMLIKDNQSNLMLSYEQDFSDDDL